jgi:hypothetical protein
VREERVQSLARLGQDEQRGTSSGFILLADTSSKLLLADSASRLLAVSTTTPYLLKSRAREVVFSSKRADDRVEDAAYGTGFILLADNSSYLLLADNSSKITLVATARSYKLKG